MTALQKHWYCTQCGSNDVVADATATWDADKQEWEMSDVCEGMWCQNCEYNGRCFELGLYDPVVYEFTDNQVTCMRCGTRTVFTDLESSDESIVRQLHECKNCKYHFVAEGSTA